MKRMLGILLLTVLLIFSCSDNRTAEQMFEDATELYEEQKYERAIRTFDKLSGSYPDDPLAVRSNYRMAEIYGGDLQDFESSIERYLYIAEKYPSHRDAPKARFMAGYTLANVVKDYERAKTQYNTFIRDYPDHDLAESVKFELRNLGKELEQIEELEGIMKNASDE
ncbi:MAG: outer membrane protein assembly factor BamD [Fidelibacterota bacterium]